MTKALDVDRARTFALAGNAHLTLRSEKTGARVTYRVRKADYVEKWFVGALTGPDNTGDYTYLGVLDREGTVRLTRKSGFVEGSRPVAAFRYFAEAVLRDGEMPPSLSVFHEGRCGRCARRLTVPESIESGLGPECRGRASTSARSSIRSRGSSAVVTASSESCDATRGSLFASGRTGSSARRWRDGTDCLPSPSWR